ncbi:hypothetical protein JCM4814A_92170 [Streptomyces phaeofaciens JCM 4814]|uniref:Uncharacterized protein n=1 Tax=Streptomyces phaeofaciens TaxID=68254 RepID=A0A918HJE3_9ACTN|nr:hypothetical protein [Streptomyces phaeofaciens]GGT70549.1 hypothetical protein GCM10010226_55520 [Streptomyces phaeofaciens]
MLNLLNKFVVPDVKGVDIYQDDDDPLQFWMVPQPVRLSTGPDGQPALSIYAFARDMSLLAGIDKPLPAGETEGGILSMSVESTVGDEDQRKIVEYLRSQVLSGALGSLRPVWDGSKVVTEPRGATQGDPKLGYPTWLEGDAQFCLPSALGPTFVKGDDSKAKPSLAGSNVASFTIALGQEGIRLFREGAKSGKLTAHVAYTLQFMARVPAITVTVSGNANNVYQELKDHTTVVETSDGVAVRTYPQVSSLKELKNISGSLQVDYTRFDFATGEDKLREQLEAFVLDITQAYLKNIFAQPVINGQLNKEKLGTDPMQNFKKPDAPPVGGNQLWLKEFEQSDIRDFGMTFHGSIARPFSAHPNAALVAMVTKPQLEKAFTEADLNTPIFHTLQVPVRVTADFANDPIAGIQVTLDYRQTDDRTGEVKAASQTYDFVKGDETYYFRTTLAKDAQGAPKDTYSYSSRLHYKAAQQSTDIAAQTTREKSLIIGYDRLGCVDVKVVAGTVPWAAVQSIQVDLKLPGVNLPSAAQTLVLTEAAQEGGWFSYTGGQTSQEYEYSCEFLLKNGSRLVTGPDRTSTARLLIDAPFEDRMAVTFVPQGLFPPLQSIVLSTKYSDEAAKYHTEGTHVFANNIESWRWEVDLPDTKNREFQYKADITYADGTTAPGQWQVGQEGTVLIGEVKSSLMEVAVTAAALDMTKWKLVVVKLRYEDPVTHEVQDETFQLTSANAGQIPSWKVTLKDPAAQSYTYEVEGYGTDGTRKSVPATSTSDELLVLEL